jgi:hypothetical protein
MASAYNRKDHKRRVNLPTLERLDISHLPIRIFNPRNWTRSCGRKIRVAKSGRASVANGVDTVAVNVTTEPYAEVLWDETNGVGSAPGVVDHYNMVEFDSSAKVPGAPNLDQFP